MGGKSSQQTNSTTTTTGTPAAQAAMPLITDDWYKQRTAVEQLGNMSQGASPALLWTGTDPNQRAGANSMANWAADISSPVKSSVQGGLNFANNVLADGWNLSSPALAALRDSQQALSADAFGKNANIFKNDAAFNGAYGGTGYNDLASRMVGQQGLVDDARNAGITNDWLSRQLQAITAAPALMGQLINVGQAPDQIRMNAGDYLQNLDRYEYETAEQNQFNTDQWGLANERARLGVPLMLGDVNQDFMNLLATAPGGSQSTTTYTKPSALSTVLGIGSLGLGAAGMFGSGGALAGVLGAAKGAAPALTNTIPMMGSLGLDTSRGQINPFKAVTPFVG